MNQLQLEPHELRFWQEVFLRAISRVGTSCYSACDSADAAVKMMRDRSTKIGQLGERF